MLTNKLLILSIDELGEDSYQKERWLLIQNVYIVYHFCIIPLYGSIQEPPF